MAGQIQQEIQQSKPLSLAVEAAINVHRTSSVLRQVVEETTHTAGSLRHVEYNVPRILRGAAPEGATLGTVRERLLADESNLLAVLGALVARGLVGREGERRVITREGLALLASVDARVESVLAERMARLTPSTVRTLIDALETLRE